MHDIGKFIFPDRILKADTSSPTRTGRSSRCTRTRAPRSLPDGGLRPGREHHPRPPRANRRQGLSARPEGDEIPELSRIISVADTYDVMTARDSYRKPVSSFEAIQELRRVSGAQLDGELRRDLHRRCSRARTSLPPRRGRRLRRGARARGADRRGRGSRSLPRRQDRQWRKQQRCGERLQESRNRLAHCSNVPAAETASRRSGPTSGRSSAAALAEASSCAEGVTG